MEMEGIELFYAARYLLLAGIILTVTGVIVRIVGNVRYKKNPKRKPPSSVGIVLFVIGLCLVVIPAIFVIFTYINVTTPQI